jgi:hypothetical protein
MKELVNLSDLKKLPIIPNTGARLKKKNLTDLGPVQNYLSLNEGQQRVDEEETEVQSNQFAVQ